MASKAQMNKPFEHGEKLEITIPRTKKKVMGSVQDCFPSTNKDKWLVVVKYPTTLNGKPHNAITCVSLPITPSNKKPRRRTSKAEAKPSDLEKTK